MQICNNPFCNALNTDLRSVLCSHKLKLKLNIKTEYLFDFNDNNILLINTGRILTVRRRASGQGKGIELLGPGSMLGITGLFTEKNYNLSLIPIVKTECCSFSKTFFLDLCKNNPEFSFLILQQSIKRFNSLIQDSEHISLDNSQEKINYILNKNIKDLTHEEIALLAGIHRVTVSNILSHKTKKFY